MKKLSIAAALLIAVLTLSACGTSAPAVQPNEPKAPEISQPGAGVSAPAETAPVPAGSAPAAPAPAAPAPAAPAQPANPTLSVRLTREQAQAIALQHAGFTVEQVTGLRTELDIDKGVAHYEVEFRVGQWEYDYDIHADTGAVLSFEKDD